MTEKKYKCPSCGTFNEKKLAVPYKNKYYCPVCFNNEKYRCLICNKIHKEEDNVYIKNKCYCRECHEEKTEGTSDYKKLITYICELFDIDAPTMVMTSQIKDFKENYKYTYRGIQTTLHYFFEIEGNEILDNAGIGIVPFVYDEAKQFYIENSNIKKNLEKIDLEDVISQVVTININKKDREDYDEAITKKGYDAYGLIDISQIGDEEDYE